MRWPGWIPSVPNNSTSCAPPLPASEPMSTAIPAKQVVVAEAEDAVHSLRANFRWMVVANCFSGTCQWGMLSVLAKAGSDALVGQFTLGLAISAPVFMLTNLHLRGVQATDACSEFEFADYFTLRVLASLAGVFTVIVVACFLHYDLATRIVIMLLAVAKAIESLGDVIAGLLQKLERLHQMAISLILRAGLSVALFGFPFLLLHILPAAA